MENIQDIESGPKGGPIYHASITMNDGQYRGFLLLFDDKISLVALRLSQPDRVRNYTWSYGKIDRVILTDPAESTHLLIFYTNDEHSNHAFEMCFDDKVERDKFAFRIRSLSKIYSQNGVSNNKGQQQGKQQEQIGHKEQTKSNGNHGPDTTVQMLSEKACDAMFLPENLKKMAISGQRSGRLSPNASSDGGPQLSTDATFEIPIEVNTGDENYSLSASARLKLVLKFDIDAMAEAGKIANRSERIKRIRELIDLKAPHCELVFS